MSENVTKVSKFLSLLLRHNPGEIGLELTNEGWAKISDLVELTRARNLPLSRDLIELVIRSNSKQRFVLSEDGASIRANQGHSISVDLGLKNQIPPMELFHGTATRFLESILREGLLKRNRQHVHLSADVETAEKVGMRHGRPVIIKVKSRSMHEDGLEFYISENLVWLTDHVPVKYLTTD